MFTISSIWLYTAYIAQRLFRLFISTYPDVAKKKIPYAFEPIQHPGKLFFFLRPLNIVYVKNHPELFRLRKRLISCLCLSFAIPMVFAGAIVLLAYLELI
jgi:hypothetical protein